MQFATRLATLIFLRSCAFCQGSDSSSQCATDSKLLLQHHRSLSVYTEIADRSRADSFREAIVVVTRSLTPPLAKWLKALEASSGDARDVWVLHDASFNSSSYPDPLQRVKFAVQPAIPRQPYQRWRSWMSFGYKRSGNSKASFILWAVKHPEYDYFWHLEDDVFFTGKWSYLFDSLSQIHADFVAKSFNMTFRPKEDWNSAMVLNRLACRAEVSYPCIAKDDLSAGFPRVLWMAARLSRRFANAIADAFNKRQARGHHELVTGVICQHVGCTMMLLPQWLQASFEPAGSGTAICAGEAYRNQSCCDCTLEALSNEVDYKALAPNKLFHPVKSDRLLKRGDPFVGDKALYWANLTT